MIIYIIHISLNPSDSQILEQDIFFLSLSMIYLETFLVTALECIHCNFNIICRFVTIVY
jgi:hypothetical protein